MGMRIRAALLLLLCAAAALTAAEALSTLSGPDADYLPEEIYARYSARADTAEFVLREEKGYVAVFNSSRGRSPVTVTGIQVSSLRSADRAMLKKGIPVADNSQLLALLEDLGS